MLGTYPRGPEAFRPAIGMSESGNVGVSPVNHPLRSSEIFPSSTATEYCDLRHQPHQVRQQADQRNATIRRQRASNCMSRAPRRSLTRSGTIFSAASPVPTTPSLTGSSLNLDDISMQTRPVEYEVNSCPCNETAPVCHSARRISKDANPYHLRSEPLTFF